MAVGDLYEVTLKGRLFEQETDNIFHYHQALDFVTTNPTKAQSLAEAWIAQKLDSIVQLVTNDVTFLAVDVKNLFDIADSYTALISVPGESGGAGAQDTMSAFNAISFTLQPETAAAGKGAKRFPGVNETNQTDGIVTNTTVLTTLAPACADAMSSPVEIGLIIPDPVFVPVLIHRVRSGTPGNYTYRLPATTGEAVFSRIAVALFNIVVKHQISRTLGVGV